MILKGQQIFSHLENTVSLPAYLYVLAVKHKQIHPKKVKGCPQCEGIYSILPDNFGSRKDVSKHEDVVILSRKSKDYDAIEKDRELSFERMREQHRNKKRKFVFTGESIKSNGRQISEGYGE